MLGAAGWFPLKIKSLETYVAVLKLLQTVKSHDILDFISVEVAICAANHAAFPCAFCGPKVYCVDEAHMTN